MTRADLPVGLAAAQVGHALIAWTLDHGRPPENLVVLRVPDEAALCALERHVRGRVPDARLCAFREPDLGEELTAIAAGPEAWRHLSSLPLL